MIGVRKREFFVLKSRGMSHSHEVREMVLSERGVRLLGPNRTTPVTRLPRASRGARS